MRLLTVMRKNQPMVPRLNFGGKVCVGTNHWFRGRTLPVPGQAQLLQLRGPSTSPLSLGELQRVANTQLHYACQRPLVETLVIVLRTEAPQHRYEQSEVATEQSEVATALPDGTWAALWPTLGLKAGELPARQQTPHAPKAGLPGACFKCSMHGHWAQACTLQQSQAPINEMLARPLAELQIYA